MQSQHLCPANAVADRSTRNLFRHTQVRVETPLQWNGVGDVLVGHGRDRSAIACSHHREPTSGSANNPMDPAQNRP